MIESSPSPGRLSFRLSTAAVLAGALSFGFSACTNTDAAPETATSTASSTSLSQPDNTETIGSTPVPDLGNGFEVNRLNEFGRTLWAVPDPSQPGCDDLPGWALWSVPDDKNDATWVASTARFRTVPEVSTSPYGGLVAIDGCRSDWQVTYAQYGETGELFDERTVTAGDSGARVIGAFHLGGSGAVALETQDDQEKSTIHVVDPRTNEVNRSFTLGDPVVGCSASGLETQLANEPELNRAQLALRDAIVEAAIACDFNRLDELVSEGFMYIFESGSGTAGELWARQDQVLGIPVTEQLVRMFEEQATIYIRVKDDPFAGWPSASIDNPDYQGFQTGMDSSGNWSYFFADD